jgi:hypothetical protein
LAFTKRQVRVGLENSQIRFGPANPSIRGQSAGGGIGRKPKPPAFSFGTHTERAKIMRQDHTNAGAPYLRIVPLLWSADG